MFYATVYKEEDFYPAIRKGMALLDERKPGWRDQIDINKFNMAWEDMCILGQLYGNYSVGVHKLFGGGNYAEAEEYGFNLPHVSTDTQYSIIDYIPIENAWLSLAFPGQKKTISKA